jgi:hypothetical protein
LIQSAYRGYLVRDTRRLLVDSNALRNHPRERLGNVFLVKLTAFAICFLGASIYCMSLTDGGHSECSLGGRCARSRVWCGCRR